MKKIKLSKLLLFTASAVLALSITSCDEKDNANISIIAPSGEPSNGNNNQSSSTESNEVILEANGYTEGAELTFNITNNNLSNVNVSYSSDNGTTWTNIDKELIRLESATTAKAYILGLKAGNYRIKADNGTNYSIKDVTVTKDDRSGYAHFKNTTGIGAYNNDGTLKNNAIVVYVNDSNKNTVKATINGNEETGLANIIKAATNANEALDIRIIGEIKTTQWNYMAHGAGSSSTRMSNLDNTFANVNWEETTENELLHPGAVRSSNYYKIAEEDIIKYGINSMSNDEANGITKLNGLTNNILKNIEIQKSGYLEYDSYYNELDVRGGNNITIEGVGSDAKIFQWGFCFNQCNSIEVKNIEFSDYTEDAIGIQGSNSDITSSSDFWIHNCTFNSGKNNWDVCYENDKKEGDGSTDFKSAHDLTISYCRYNGTHKTALIGSGSTSYQYNVTFHHNFYNACGSRLPYTRNTNFHIYNCYYKNSTGTNMQIESNAYAFIEGCYFENTKKTFTNSGGVIKLYKNTIDSTATTTTGTNINYVTDRTETVTNSCIADKVTDYSKFDTNKELFYFDDVKNISDVELMLKSTDVKSYIPTVAGSGLLNTIDYSKNYVETNEGYTEPEVTGVTYADAIPTESGWYGNIQEYPLKSDGKPDTSNGSSVAYASDAVVQEQNGKIVLTDTSSTKTTFAYYIFDQSYTTGVHTYTVSVKTGTNKGSKWSFIQFLDGNKNIAIRSCADSKLGYSVDGGTTEVGLSNLSIDKNTEYTIILTVDYDNDTIKVSINGNELTINGWTESRITGIQFMTAAAAADRSFTVNSVTVE